jgi:energy-coupling factor transporter ATP-binding protein EcfA2
MENTILNTSQELPIRRERDVITNKFSILCYGASGSGKSTQARYVAEFVWREYKKKTRLIALDRGSLWSPCQDLVDQGTIIPLEFPTSFEYNPFAIMRKLRRGEWPKDGFINKPTAVEEKNAKGEIVKISYKMNTTWLPWAQKETDEIGAIVVDSITSFATSFMSDVKQKNQRIGNSDSAPRVEDGEQMGTNTQAHYGDAHTEVLDALQAYQALPVYITLFTALEGLGETDVSGVKRPQLGPETVGKAITGIIPNRVNYCFHLVTEGVGNKKIIKAWCDKHPSELGERLMWPAKVSLPPADLKEFWSKFPNGYVPLSLEKGIGEFLEFINRKKV